MTLDESPRAKRGPSGVRCAFIDDSGKHSVRCPRRAVDEWRVFAQSPGDPSLGAFSINIALCWGRDWSRMVRVPFGLAVQWAGRTLLRTEFTIDRRLIETVSREVF